jgi:hypothetical protein
VPVQAHFTSTLDVIREGHDDLGFWGSAACAVPRTPTSTSVASKTRDILVRPRSLASIATILSR